MFKTTAHSSSEGHKQQKNFESIAIKLNWCQQCLKHLKYLLCGFSCSGYWPWREAWEWVFGCKETGWPRVTHGHLLSCVSSNSPWAHSHGPAGHSMVHQIAQLATKILVVLGTRWSFLSSAFSLVWLIICWLHCIQLLFSVTQKSYSHSLYSFYPQGRGRKPLYFISLFNQACNRFELGLTKFHEMWIMSGNANLITAKNERLLFFFFSVRQSAWGRRQQCDGA